MQERGLFLFSKQQACKLLWNFSCRKVSAGHRSLIDLKRFFKGMEHYVTVVYRKWISIQRKFV